MQFTFNEKRGNSYELPLLFPLNPVSVTLL